MQTELQKLIVLREQFQLKALSDEALKKLLPAYQQAMLRLQREMAKMLEKMPGVDQSIERQLWLKTQMANIYRQLAPVGDLLPPLVNEYQRKAFDLGMENAQKYLGEVRSDDASGRGFNTTSGGGEQEFLSPDITKQQVAAAVKKKGFEEISVGGKTYEIDELGESWNKSAAKQAASVLRAGFLTGQTNEQISRDLIGIEGSFGGTPRQGWAMAQAIVRTSMAEASQSAHDAFYEANAELLPPTAEGYRWWWDASNDTRLCKICAPLDGVKFKERSNPPKPWPAHWSCRCKILPITATMEELERTEGPASGSFLEATPVKKDRNGKRLPRPAGYDGDNAYKNPMKIDGEYQWVRRRDMGPGETTAGFMLKNANENSKKIILGSDDLVKSWNKQIKTEQYSKDPQALVRKLLGEPLGPNYQLPQYPGGPKPKPPAPKPPAPEPPAQEPDWKAQIELMDRTGAQWVAGLGKGMTGGRAVQERYSRVLPQLLAKKKELLYSGQSMSLRERRIALQKIEDTLQVTWDSAQRGRAAVVKGSEKIRASMLRRGLSISEAKAVTADNPELALLSDGMSLMEGAKNKKKLYSDALEYARLFKGEGLKVSARSSVATHVRVIKQNAGEDRGYNMVAVGAIQIPVGERGKSVLFHEIAHTVEAQRPWLGAWARQWSRDRAFDSSHPSVKNLAVDNMLEGKPRYKLNELIPYSGYQEGETAWVDSYLNPYMGKQYPKGDTLSTEVWTLAVEHFSTPERMADLFRKHPDLFRAVVGFADKLPS